MEIKLTDLQPHQQEAIKQGRSVIVGTRAYSGADFGLDPNATPATVDLHTENAELKARVAELEAQLAAKPKEAKPKETKAATTKGKKADAKPEDEKPSESPTGDAPEEENK